MELKGTGEFIRQAVAVAARKNMNIEFVDPDQNAALLTAKERMRKGMERTELHREKEKAQAPGETDKEEMLSAAKRAARQQQRAQQVDADQEQDQDRERDIDTSR